MYTWLIRQVEVGGGGMKPLKQFLAAILMMTVAGLPALAQLDRVIVQARPGDIDCLPCAATIEMALRKIASVDKVAVSMSKQMVAITFKEGARFEPKAYRDAIAQAEVRVDEFHVAMRGKVEQAGDKHYLVSGKDRFLIVNLPKDLPIGPSLGVMVTADDSTEPPSITSLEEAKPL